MNERLKLLRKTLKLSQEAFAEKIGMKGSSISLLEKGRENGGRNITDPVIKSICNVSWNGNFVNEEWIRTGNGEMFLPPEDEVGILVSQLIDDKNNPSLNLILETMRTFNQLTPEDQKIIASYCEQLLHNLKDKKES